MRPGFLKISTCLQTSSCVAPVSRQRSAILRGLLMRRHTLLGDTERCEGVEHRNCGRCVGSTVIQSEQDVAVEIDKTHGQDGVYRTLARRTTWRCCGGSCVILIEMPAG